MGKRVTEARLVELRGTIPHCQPFDKLTAEYLGKSFAEPVKDHPCVNCGETGTFTWGLAHGEGHCHSCAWPARLYHFVKDADGKEDRVVYLLWYHPDGISLRTKAA